MAARWSPFTRIPPEPTKPKPPCGVAARFDIKQRALQWQSAGWRGYDADAKPLSAEEIERERQQLREREAEEAELRR